MTTTPPQDDAVPRDVRRVVLAPRGGEVTVERGAPPILGPGEVLVRTAYSVVSPGTERSKLELASRGLIGKARSRPELVRQVIEKARREGAAATVRAVRRRLGESMPLGYSSSGIVLAVGARVDDLLPGDRVAAGGGGYALHADVVAVPKQLVARVPDEVPLDAAALATLGSVGMHGFRLSGAGLGETVAVVGLGVVGLLAGAVARAAGCRVVGVDVRPEALERALAHGFVAAASPEDAEELVRGLTDGRGADAILLAAAAADNAPMVLAGRIARDRASVVVVGDVPVNAPREAYFEKELRVVVSRSYGPGRYDPSYEEGGHDYPIGYVRWTERRNADAFLRLLADGAVDGAALFTHRFDVERAAEAYQVLGSTPGSVVLLEYGDIGTAVRPEASRVPAPARPSGAVAGPRVGVIGTGSFAERILLPAIRAAGASVEAVASAQGRPGRESLGARLADSPDELLSAGLDAIFVATRHDSHARLAAAALRAGTPVFVEKPLALSREELDDVVAAWSAANVAAMVGFNRRHAALAAALREGAARAGGPAVLTIRVNAGPLEPGHWARDLEVGGGRILGEVCHFVDLASDLAGADAREVHAVATRGPSPQAAEDLVVTLRMDDGSVASIVYSALGDPALGKERIEVFRGGQAWVIDDWRALVHTTGGRRTQTRGEGDKGHAAEVAAFVAAVRRGDGLEDSFRRDVAATRATLAVVESLATGLPVEP